MDKQIKGTTKYMLFSKRKELAEEYEEWVKTPLEDGSKIKDCALSVITFMQIKGYRKIPENAVVLMREEYEKLKQYEEKVKSGACFTQKEWLELCDEECKRNTENLSKARQLERKETAEKFAERLKQLFPINEDIFRFSTSEQIQKAVDEICKEITEGKV